MMMIIENIVKIFVNDTHICAVNALQLMKYQMKKHNWTYEQWNEYYQIYINNLNDVGYKGINDTFRQVENLDAQKSEKVDKRDKAVICFTKEGVYKLGYESVRIASTKVGVPEDEIIDSCNGKPISSMYIWKFANKS